MPKNFRRRACRIYPSAFFNKISRPDANLIFIIFDFPAKFKFLKNQKTSAFYTSRYSFQARPDNSRRTIKPPQLNIRPLQNVIFLV